MPDDRPCLTRAWRERRSELHGWLRHRLDGDAEADDLLQEVFLRALRQGDAFCALDNPPPPPAGDTQTLTLGGRTLELRYFDHAHFAGDHIYVDRVLGILPESNAETWLKAFRLAIALQPARIVPGHGQVCDMAQAQRETGDYLGFVVAGTKKFAEDMAGVDAAIAALKDAPAFKHLRNFDDLHRGNVNRAYLRFESAQ